jgi:hypothetical protein
VRHANGFDEERALLERHGSVPVLERDGVHAAQHGVEPGRGDLAHPRHRLRRGIESQVRTRFQQAQDVNRREVVLVIVADEHGVETVEGRLAREERALQRVGHALVAAEVVPEQRVEHHFGPAIGDEHRGIGQILRRRRARRRRSRRRRGLAGGRIGRSAAGHGDRGRGRQDQPDAETKVGVSHGFIEPHARRPVSPNP